MIKQLLTLLLFSTSILFSDTLLEVELEHNATSTDPLEIIVKLTNVSEDVIEYDIAFLPSKDGLIRSGVFTLSEDNQSIPYEGILALFEDRTYEALSSGETRTFSVSLSKEYGVHTGAHEYEVSFSKTIRIKDNNTSKLIDIISNSLELIATIKPQEEIKVPHTRSTLSTCSNHQRSLLSGYLNKAKTLTHKAVNRLNTHNSQDRSYRVAFSTANYNTVKHNFSKINSALYQNIQFNCAPRYPCSQNPNTPPIAWVHKNQPYNINLCPIFFNNNNSVERAKILVHEISHFNAVAGTDDGQSGDPAREGSRYGFYAKSMSYLSGNGGGGGGTSNINYEFNSHNNAQGWTYRNLRQHGSGPMDGRWYFIARYNDPQLISPALNLNANVIKKVVVKMANDHNPAHYGRMQIFWKKNGQGYSEANSQTVSVTNHGGWTTYTIDMSNNPRWNGNIQEIRIDPIDRGDGHWLAFDYIRFTQ